MTPSTDALVLSEWVAAVVRELGLDPDLAAGDVTDLVLDLTADVAHGVSRPAAPVTAFLIGVAAGRAADTAAADPVAAAREHAGTIAALARGWEPT